MDELDPGTYDGLVVDAEEVDENVVSIEVALTSGPHKGAVVHVRGRAQDAIRWRSSAFR